VMGIVTDSTPLAAPKDPDRSTIVDLYRLVASPADVERMRNDFRAGGIGYGEFKQRLFEAIRDYFAPYRARREELLADRERVDAILAEGAERAREIARRTYAKVARAVGIA
jgi:tryptophanyl-tRNA synthetase